MLNDIYAECRKQAHYAECNYAECRGTLKVSCYVWISILGLNCAPTFSRMTLARMTLNTMTFIRMTEGKNILHFA